jgi:hypothetical protein
MAACSGFWASRGQGVVDPSLRYQIIWGLWFPVCAYKVASIIRIAYARISLCCFKSMPNRVPTGPLLPDLLAWLAEGRAVYAYLRNEAFGYAIDDAPTPQGLLGKCCSR